MMNLAVSRFFLLMAALGGGVSAQAAERAVPCKELPTAVQESSKAFLQDGAAGQGTGVSGMTVRGCVKDVSASGTTYEMELATSAGSKDVTFSPAGEVLEVEAEVQRAALPGPVAAAFERAALGGKLGKVESLTRKGQLVGYESTVVKGGRRRELAFRPDGTAMKPD